MKKIKNPGKVAVITLGCSKNQVDSERILGALQSAGIKITDYPESADTMIINTCGFIKPAKEESLRAIMEAVGLKADGILRRVIVTGCLSERYRDDLEGQLDGVDYFGGINSESEIVEALTGIGKPADPLDRVITGYGHYAYLKISEGCNHKCSFCAIPLIRGAHVSRPKEEIIEEARALVNSGTKELIVIAQDTTYYGVDLYGKKMIAELLSELSDINGAERIRLMYTYPTAFPEDVLDVMRKKANICNYIDIPLQHISDRILKSMRRGMTGDETRTLVRKIRERVPGIAIRSTFIVGYPGETEAEFEELCDFIREFKFERAGVFTYSHEENTPAFEEKDNVPDKVKDDRRNRLMEIQQEISLERNKSLVGSEIEVIADDIDNKTVYARSEFDAPEVDNAVIIKKAGKLKPGDILKVHVKKAEPYDLFAEPGK